MPFKADQGAERASALFTTFPSISQNPNPSVPLAAIVRFSAREPVHTTIELGDGEREWTLDFAQDPAKGLPILGMRPGRRHVLRISIQDANGDIVSAPQALEYTTPPLPSGRNEFPPLHLTVNRQEEVEPGFRLLSIRQRVPGDRGLSMRYGLLLALVLIAVLFVS